MLKPKPITIEKLVKSKPWISVLGSSYQLTDDQKTKILTIIDLIDNGNYRNRIKIIANFVKYNLDNYKYRLNLILENLTKNTLEMYCLRYGKIEGELRYKQYCSKLSKVSSKDYFIEHYGELEGIQKFNKIQKKKLMSLDGFIKRNGLKIGTKKYKDFCNKNKGNWSLERQIHLHGKINGKQNYLDIKENVKKTQSLNGFIENHGIVDGTNLWNKRMEKMWYSSSEESYKERFGENYQEIMRFQKDHTSLKSFINRYGKELGTIKFKEFCDKVRITLKTMIKKYGEIEGTKKFNQWKKTTVSAFCSPISQKFCWELYNKLDNDLKQKTYFAELQKEFIKADREYCYCYDFVISSIKLCFEFNGDLFHANPVKYKENDTPNPFDKELTSNEIWKFDKIKKEKLESFGYKVFIVWESDYRKNPVDIINDCFLKIQERLNE